MRPVSVLRATSLLTLAWLVLPAATAAELSLTPTLTSDYDFRGISLSEREPALQFQFDFATDSGFKGYAWISNTEYGIEGLDTEVDLLLGWGGKSGGLDWDVGAVWYAFPSFKEFDYPEVYIGTGKSFGDRFDLSLKVWYSWDYVAAGDSAYYLEVNGNVALGAGYGLALHAGRSEGDYWDRVNDDGYTDFSVGVTKSFGKFDFALKYVDGSDLPDVDPTSDIQSTESKAVLSVSTKFPWSD